MKRWKQLMIRTVLGALACFAGKGVFAQYETSSARYMYSQYFINPAYSAISNVMTATLMARKQWFGIEGSPSGLSGCNIFTLKQHPNVCWGRVESRAI